MRPTRIRDRDSYESRTPAYTEMPVLWGRERSADFGLGKYKPRRTMVGLQKEVPHASERVSHTEMSLLREVLRGQGQRRCRCVRGARVLPISPKALAILDKCCPQADYLRGIVERMKSYAKEKNTIAFKI